MLEEFLVNPGTKIKKIPKILLAIYLICGGLSAVVILFSSPELFLLSLLMFAVGFVSVLISCLYMYAYGEMVESTSSNAQLNAEILKILKRHYGSMNNVSASNQVPTVHAGSLENNTLNGQAAEVPPGGWRCHCGRVNYPYVTSCACGKNKWDVIGNK